MFDCRDCGDCSLPEIAYLCPESQCVKNQRNGPCGGTRDGKCEVGDKECIWALAYERLKAYGEEDELLPGVAVIVDGEASQLGLLERVRDDSEVHFLPAIGGGA